MTDRIHVFVYDARQPAGEANMGHEKVRDDTVQGTLFEVEGVGPALMLSGHDTIPGEIRSVDPRVLDVLDARAGVGEGLYRRVGVQVGETPCWTWVAGPALGPRLESARRVRGPRERDE